ncbi:molybdate ABC transporter substrate-binding protein [Corynebacterium terpenotabidum]|uniref:Molybdate-binding protein n=1 Tax=Corynebacterium terpenotabidum Y-11 TaxID=1200352 RepID=S4XGA9_9CORY|nr:molybdate ABC transporter substrate-binding protein [Corynebacterium terpenotabidum]AGP31571.1 molybdate-binding protein [Corynebacterium terpenotabidum Y-11]
MTRTFHLTRSALIAVVAMLAALVLLTATACSNSQQDSTQGTASGAASGAASADSGDSHGQVTVFAAASLKNVGDELAEAFAADGHDGAEITFNFAGSSKLVQQIEQGAEADLFISADESNMATATELPEFEDADPQVIATNRLVLATAPGNLGSITDLSDLKTNDKLRIALCADGVPCGTLAHEYLESAGVTLNNPTEEANVSDVATKVSTGDVDAGFIYSTDAQALQENLTDSQGQIIVLDLPGIEDNSYPAALTRDGEENQTAQDFLAWLQTDTAQEILAQYGFGSPA